MQSGVGLVKKDIYGGRIHSGKILKVSLERKSYIGSVCLFLPLSTCHLHLLFYVVPIGKDGNSGLAYPVNPRFDSKGRWRPRREWPRELQER